MGVIIACWIYKTIQRFVPFKSCGPGPMRVLQFCHGRISTAFFFSRNILELCISVVFFFLSFDKLSTSFVKAFTFIVHPEVVYNTLMLLPHYCIYSM